MMASGSAGSVSIATHGTVTNHGTAGGSARSVGAVRISILNVVD